MEKDGVKLLFNTTVDMIQVVQGESDNEGYPLLKLTCLRKEGEFEVEVNAILLATGRKPNVDGMDLEKAGVEYDHKVGVRVNDNLRTSNPNIYAVGDCCCKYQFTHNSGQMGRLVIRNALFFGKKEYSKILLPWCTYTEPEIAHVGKYSHELQAIGK
mmetsp:Transcript_5263/g.4856  ORF Transcript_5263/g.4856 Transcript_5263/m.4856 type:complete len:157 (+) Transcript_5263:799-1269(+)